MSLDRNELFEKLLQQLQWQKAATMPYFQGAQIDRLEVHQQSNRWQFDITTPRILPFEVFTDFNARLKAAFTEIASVSLNISATDNNFNEQLLRQYWQWVVVNSGVTSPLIKELCEDKSPSIVDSRIEFVAENDIVKDFMTNTALGPIEEMYQQAGFPNFTIHTIVDESTSQQNIKALKQKNEAANAKLVKKANEAIKSNAAKPKRAGGPAKGIIGRKIKSDLPVTQLEEITEEERSIVVSGYVFNKEIRELRSGRQLLMLKITDYTSSIQVKKFSNKGEEALFEGVNEGDWVKVRGNVQEDNYSHELTLNAYDINPVKTVSRQDSAPEGEKRVELHLHTSMSQMDATNNIADFTKQAKKMGA